MYNLSHIFSNIKADALACRDKSYGKCLTYAHRLHYDQYTDTVSLYQRDGNEYKLFTVDNCNNISFHFLDNSFYQSDGNRISQMLGYYIHSIPTSNKLRADYTYYIYPYPTNKHHIYIPNDTVFNVHGELLSDTEIKRWVYNKEWNRKFIALSKLRRRDITSFHRMVPRIPDEVKLNFRDDDYNEDLINTILHAKVNKSTLIELRNAFRVSDNNKILNNKIQDYLNKVKPKIAKKEKALEYEYIKNEFTVK